MPTSSGAVMFSTGIVSFAHFIPSGLFQSKLLFRESQTKTNNVLHFWSLRRMYLSPFVLNIK